MVGSKSNMLDGWSVAAEARAKSLKKDVAVGQDNPGGDSCCASATRHGRPLYPGLVVVWSVEGG